MQISYYSVLTKIQKLQNLKNKNKKKIKKKNFFFVPASIARNWSVRPVFFQVQNRRSSVLDYWPVRYIPAVPAGTVRSDNLDEYTYSLYLNVK